MEPLSWRPVLPQHGSDENKQHPDDGLPGCRAKPLAMRPLPCLVGVRRWSHAVRRVVGRGLFHGRGAIGGRNGGDVGIESKSDAAHGNNGFRVRSKCASQSVDDLGDRLIGNDLIARPESFADGFPAQCLARLPAQQQEQVDDPLRHRALDSVDHELPRRPIDINAEKTEPRRRIRFLRIHRATSNATMVPDSIGLLRRRRKHFGG